jgi:hypothetical protein
VTADLVINTLALCVVLAGTETLHGIARTVLVVPRIGKARALKLSILSGTALAFVICCVLVPDLGLATLSAHLMLGPILALFMAGFDLALAKLLLKRPWSKAFSDFNPATGNYLTLGLMTLIFVQAMVASVRGLV